nr:ATP-binding protein [Anaerobacillus isosaccharinicus]
MTVTISIERTYWFGNIFSNCFGVSACRQFYNVKDIRLPELLDELSLAKLAADGSYRKLIKKYTKVDLLHP